MHTDPSVEQSKKANTERIVRVFVACTAPSDVGHLSSQRHEPSLSPIRSMAFSEPTYCARQTPCRLVRITTAHHLRPGRGYRSAAHHHAGPFVRCMRTVDCDWIPICFIGVA